MEYYFLPDQYLEKINECLKDSSDAYSDLGLIFRESFVSIGPDNFSFQKEKGERLFVVNHKENERYTGKLWNNEEIKHIGLADYIYTTPLWDWWISPLLNRGQYRKKNASFIFTEKINEKSAQGLIKSFENEGYSLLRTENLSTPFKKNEKDVQIFKEMLFGIFPRKMAREAERIGQMSKNKSETEKYYISRGGYLPSQLVSKNTSFSPLYVSKNRDQSPSMLSSDSFILDDMIGTGNTLNNLYQINPNFAFATFDSTLPQSFYEKLFPGVDFLLPKDMLNIYASRLFENQPELMGIDLDSNGEILEHSGIVRDKFIARIDKHRGNPDLEKRLSLLVNW